MIKITENARLKIIDILREENKTNLRFGLRGGGCNGFTYFLTIEENIEADDVKINLGNGYILCVDVFSMQYLENIEIDYKIDIMGESFIFNNPNATGHCGCGNSTSFG